MLDKIDQVVMLKDFYGPLLTAKQQEILSLHYENDWSLSEIAQSLNISRQAVYDIVKRAEALLEEYESKLGLVAKFQAARTLLDELNRLLQGAAINQSTNDRAAELITEIAGLL